MVPFPGPKAPEKAPFAIFWAKLAERAPCQSARYYRRSRIKNKVEISKGKNPTMK